MTLLGIDKPTDTTQVKLWGEEDLLTPTLRREKLETLLCQKVQQGEDPTLCQKVLDYLYFSAFQDKLNRIAVQKEKERSVFLSVQQVFITSFAILGLFAFLAAACNKSVVRSPSLGVNPPAIEQQAPGATPGVELKQGNFNNR
ncbi:hypothetical protein [Anabaena azotica]|uniref:Uncharacterized protein n=1 Tax=Anabaena azotica FACHB-119 TaxID=947527 RepID=A0ABR8DGI5_9NOST|nr:hypothetical protein [Anabaena azotica]MBD2505520.1 hypothetical protein [Anabaena azotica FACHB-119]